MQLTTSIDIPKSSFQIDQNNKIMLLGSCFADNIGDKFVKSGFDTLVNPFGTLYNPASIAALLIHCMENKDYTRNSKEIFCSDDGIWHSWMHHSKFSSNSFDELIDNINGKTYEASLFLKQADILVITLGTSIIFFVVKLNPPVSNKEQTNTSIILLK